MKYLMVFKLWILSVPSQLIPCSCMKLFAAPVY